MDKSLLVVGFILCVIWTIASHNRIVKQVKLGQLRDIKSNINNALSLYDCLYIHINMYSKGFTEGKSLTSKTVMFKEGTLEYIESHYEADSETYKTALATYKSRLLSEVNLELNKYNY